MTEVGAVPVPAVPAEEARCPVCATALGESSVSCPRCETRHHPECWEYAGGCAIFGCSAEPSALPVDRGDHEQTARAALRWRTVRRLQWGAFAVANGALGACLAMAPVFVVLEPPRWRYVAYPPASLWEGCAWFVAAMLLVVMVAALTHLALGPLVGWARRSLEERLGVPLAPPRAASRALLDRLQVGRFWLTLGGARRCAAAFALWWAAWMVTLYLGWGLYEPGLLGFCLFGFVLLFGVGSAARQSDAYVASVENRVLASFKGRR